MDYDEMLKNARKKIPEMKSNSERFEVPKVKGHIQGSTTVITNFFQIANYLHRKPEHFLKFLLKEIAAPGDLKNNLLIIGRKVSSNTINDKINKYVQKYVICSECKKPDTIIERENNIEYLKCLACGARKPIIK